MLKKKWLLLVICILLTSLSSLSGCGGSGVSGEGNTVYITASGKSNTSFSIYTNLLNATTLAYLTGSFDYTIKSTVYPGSTGIKSSDVLITEAQISYIPLGSSPALFTWTKYPAGLITPGGTLDLNMSVVDSHVMSFFDNNSPAVTSPNSEYAYIVSVVFKGTEVNTGVSVTCPPVQTNLYITKNLSLF